MVELVDTRDLKSLDVRVVPVQVRPGAPSNAFATLAQLVERNLAKVEVTSSNLVCRSKFKKPQQKCWGFFGFCLVHGLISEINAQKYIIRCVNLLMDRIKLHLYQY